jgi:hypothetical protein
MLVQMPHGKVTWALNVQAFQMTFVHILNPSDAPLFTTASAAASATRILTKACDPCPLAGTSSHSCVGKVNTRSNMCLL